MSVAAPAKSPGISAKKMITKPKVTADHPKYSDMIAAAITSLKERGGSSRHAIVKHIMSNYKVGTNQVTVNTRIKTSLKSGVTKGNLKQVKGTGAAGSFRLGEEKVEKKPKVVQPKKVKTPKKATTAKPKTKKVATKPQKATAVKQVAKPKKAKTPTKAKATAAETKSTNKPKKDTDTKTKLITNPKKVETTKKKVVKKTVTKK